MRRNEYLVSRLARTVRHASALWDPQSRLSVERRVLEIIFYCKSRPKERQVEISMILAGLSFRDASDNSRALLIESMLSPFFLCAEPVREQT